MTQWVNTLDLRETWKKLEEEEISVQDGAKEIITKIKKFPKFEFNDELKRIVDEFELVEEDVEEFDNCMKFLYDWGDDIIKTRRHNIVRNCWIRTV